jgi:NapC/NirT cytochrome c family, N-terminal region
MSWKPSATVLLALVAGAIAFGGIAIPLTNHPQFCASCHTIAPSYESWEKSSHKEVTCVACHVRPGVEGWIHDKAWAGTKDVAIYLFGTPTESHNLKATVDSNVCLSCHRNILRVSEIAPRDLPSPVKDLGLVMSHRKHMEAFEGGVRGARAAMLVWSMTSRSRAIPSSFHAGMCRPTANPGIQAIRKDQSFARERSMTVIGVTMGKPSIKARCSNASAKPAICLIR